MSPVTSASLPGRMPLARYTSGADVTGHPRHPDDLPPSCPARRHPGAKARRRHFCLIMSLGISLPCQVMHADLLLVCTLVYRR